MTGQPPPKAEMDYAFRYTPVPNDALDIARLANPWFFRGLTLFPVVAFAASLVLLLVGDLTDLVAHIVGALWGVAIFGAIYALAFPTWRRRQIARKYPQIYAREITLTFDAEGLHGSTAGIATDRSYATMTHFRWNKHVIIIWDGRLGVWTIPARAFRDPAEYQAFRESLARQLSPQRARVP